MTTGTDAEGQTTAGANGGLLGVGQRLRMRREQLGLSLRDIEDSTKIRVRYLEAIESGEVGALPGIVYATGFVRSYGDAVGLDGAVLAADFRRAAEGRSRAKADAAAAAKSRPAPPPRPAGEQVAAKEVQGSKTPAGAAGAGAPPPKHAATAVPPPPPPAAPPKDPQPRVDMRPLEVPMAVPQSALPEGRRRRAGARTAPQRSAWRPWLTVLILLAVALGAYVLHAALQEPDPGGGIGDPGHGQQPPGGTEPPPDPPPPVFGRDRIAVLTGDAGELLIQVDWEALEVTLLCGQRVWLRADTDGERVVDGTREQGAEIKLTASERIEIRLGRALPTTINVMGVDLGSAGPQDDARTVIVTRRQ